MLVRMDTNPMLGPLVKVKPEDIIYSDEVAAIMGMTREHVSALARSQSIPYLNTERWSNPRRTRLYSRSQIVSLMRSRNQEVPPAALELYRGLDSLESQPVYVWDIIGTREVAEMLGMEHTLANMHAVTTLSAVGLIPTLLAKSAGPSQWLYDKRAVNSWIITARS